MNATKLRSLYVVCLSVCRLSVRLMHPTHRVERFGNIFKPSNSIGTRTVFIEILEKQNSKGF